FDSEMKADVTVAPLAEVMVGGESGMGGYTTETVTKTVVLPASTSVVTRVVTETVGGGVVTRTVTNTITAYSTYTVKDTVTVYKTETVRTELTVTKDRTVTVTKTETVVKTITSYTSYGYHAGVLILSHPFSEFIFIGGGRR
ncbi:MAG: hypothetical protein QXZ17_15080, partial [Nitrososphaerota archaeon]